MSTQDTLIKSIKIDVKMIGISIYQFFDVHIPMKDHSHHNKHTHQKGDQKQRKEHIWTPEIIVFGGGGVKGLSLPGVLMVLSRNNFMDNVHTYVGTSIGGFVAALCSLNFTHLEINNIMQTVDIDKLMNDFSVSSRFKNNYAVDDEWFQEELTNILSTKELSPDITLSQSYQTFGKNLYLSTVNRKTRRLVMINHTTHPDLTVIEALKMTSCVPCVFKSPQYEGSSFWDGGLLDNYPVSHFDSDKVLGVRLGMRGDPPLDSMKPFSVSSPFEVSILDFIGSGISDLYHETMEIIDIMMEESERVRLAGKCFREITVNTKHYKSFSLSVKTEDKNALILAGIQAAIEFMKDSSPKIHIPYTKFV